jgi:hypothetical protein
MEEISTKRANVSLIIDSYEDLFSSFDPRSYSERALSDDFIDECKRAVRDKEEGFELRFLLPKNKRNFKEETQIKKRLRDHFLKHYHQEEKATKKLKRQGIKWFIVGIGFMLFATSIYEIEGFFFDLLRIMSEPAGWFSFWEGLGKIFISADERRPRAKFNLKMAQAKVLFQNY